MPVSVVLSSPVESAIDRSAASPSRSPAGRSGTTGDELCAPSGSACSGRGQHRDRVGATETSNRVWTPTTLIMANAPSGLSSAEKRGQALRARGRDPTRWRPRSGRSRCSRAPTSRLPPPTTYREIDFEIVFPAPSARLGTMAVRAGMRNGAGMRGRARRLLITSGQHPVVDATADNDPGRSA